MADRAPPAPKVIADRFELLERAGAGGMGEVWRARDRATGGLVALKLLLAADATTQARFEREAAGLAKVQHPHVVPFLDHGIDGERGPWLVMGWLEGESLAARLRRGKIGSLETVEIGRALGAALGAVHAVGLVHRDLKPANVILRDDGGGPCLVDFGLVRALEGESGITGQGNLVGTPRYMAPEQVRGTPPADERADLWALGTVLYECLAGAPTFSGKEGLAVLTKVLLEPIEPIEAVATDVGPDLAALVARLLKRDREERPRTAGEVCADLERIATRAAAARTHPAPTGISGEARRLAALVVVAPPPGSDPAIAAALAQATASVSGLHRAVAERMRSEGVVVTVPGRAGVRDQALVAARVALALRTEAPGARIAVTLARTAKRREPAGAAGATASTLGLGAAIDRATTLLGLDRGAGPVPIDEGTARLLAQRFVVEASSPGVHHLVSERASSSASLFTAASTPLVGRAREMRALLARARATFAGAGASACLVVGDVGVGKSRLVREVLAAVRGDGTPLGVWFAQGDPSRDASPWSIAGDLVRSATGLSASVAPELAATVLERLVAPVTPTEERGRTIAFLGETLGIAIPGTAEHLRAVRADFALWGDHVRRSLHALVAAATSTRADGSIPALAIVIDDAHFADRPTAEWLARTIAQLRDRRLHVIVAGRPAARERMAALARAEATAEIALGDLGDDDVRALVLAVARQTDRAVSAAGIADRVVQQAGGNPLFAEQLLDGLMRGRDAGGASLLALAEERLATIDEGPAEVLRAASVFGRTFSRDALPALLPGRATTIDADLAALADQGWIVGSGSQARSGHALAFRHGVLRDAAYAQMPEADRVRAHALLAAWLDRHGEREPAVIAAHWALAREDAEAAPHFARAAERALTGSDFDGAITLARRALDHAREERVRGRAALAIAEAHRWKGATEDARAAAEMAMATLPLDSERWFLAAAEHLVAASRLHRLGELVATATKLEATLDRAPTPAQVVAVARAATLLLHANIDVRAAPLYAWLDDVSPALDSEPIAAFRRAFAFAWRAHAQDDWAAYARLLRIAAAGAERAGDTRTACQMRANVGHALVELGAYREARTVLETERAIAKEAGLVMVVALCNNNLGPALARTGDLEAAIAAVEAAIATYAKAGDERMVAASRAYLADHLREAGRLDAALEAAERSVEGARTTPVLLPRSHAVLADVHRARHDVASAVTAARHALSALATAGKSAGNSSWVHLAAAEAFLAADLRDAASEQARLARREVISVTAKIEDFELRSLYMSTPQSRRILELSTTS